MDVKGFESVRRDYAPFVSSSQKVVFEKLVGEEDVEGSIEYIKGVVSKLVEGNMPLEELTMCKQLTRAPEDYKSNSIHVELAKRLKRELPETMAPKVGDRIEYVVRTGSDKLFMRGVQPSEVADGTYKLDLAYYMNKQLREPCMRIFTMVMDNASTLFYAYDKDADKRKAIVNKRKREEKQQAYRKKLKVKDIRSFFS